MPLPNDLRDYRASNGFALISESEEVALIAVLIALALVLDRLGVLA